MEASVMKVRCTCAATLRQQYVCAIPGQGVGYELCSRQDDALVMDQNAALTAANHFRDCGYLDVTLIYHGNEEDKP